MHFRGVDCPQRKATIISSYVALYINYEDKKATMRAKTAYL
ncbi:hypothetical protein ACFQ3N_14605 [Virgibacillus byunsanensis]|uniref:Uncharacterized protein n=1 Tax=Virgibacillus byunsanensis TaxID=570945 RepID=A0ABW3LMP5_9BACI